MEKFSSREYRITNMDWNKSNVPSCYTGIRTCQTDLEKDSTMVLCNKLLGYNNLHVSWRNYKFYRPVLQGTFCLGAFLVYFIYSYTDYCFAGEKEYLTLEVLMNL